ncbi:MAG: single-stranded-DNA-specific exonuclease RecJ [Wenzhouxiangella sp.]|nr:MAG: single-stranded-DNA-specific exonuclease RecJ [Wenzhouxiangella sp.]
MIRQVRIQRRSPTVAQAPDLHPVAARVLAGRGLDKVPDYALSGLLPPTLSGLGRGAELLAQAIERGQRILVVGDFDADGATGCAVAVRALKLMGAKHVDWLVPDRFRHGYGLSPELVTEIGAPIPDVLLTVDQGISSLDGVALARQRGARVIVTDHHLPGPDLPAADAIINPCLADDPFPSRALAGVGVVFYLMLALRKLLRERNHFGQHQPRLDALLDLVALGTVADLVPLDENNRRLVAQGLSRIRAGRVNPGIRALLEVAGRNLAWVNASDLGFAAAPRLNAAGRLDDMGIGIRCLLADNDREARSLADRLDQLNAERRSIQDDMQAHAEVQADRMSAELGDAVQGLCVFDPDWHQGVVGLVAGRLMERLQRPVIAFAPAEEGSDMLKGSGRSPAGLHMRDVLVDISSARPGLIPRFGGHARAAGLSLARNRLDDFRAAFEQRLASERFGEEFVTTDGALRGDEFTIETVDALDQVGPWGQAWPEPLFDGRFRIESRRVVGQDHLKLRLRSTDGGPGVDAIAFRAGRLCHQELPEPLHLTYRPELNRWRGQVSLQLVIQHLVKDQADV